MEALLKHLKTYNLRRVLVGIVVLLFICLFLLINQISSPDSPKIEITSGNEFVGDSFVFTGIVTADCRCRLSLLLNGDELELDEDGNFSTEVDPYMEAGEWEYELVAVTHGGLLNLLNEEKTKSGSIEREDAAIVMDPKVSEWGEASIELHFSGLVGSTVSVTAVTSYYGYDSLDESQIQLSTKNMTIDDTGLFSLSVPFENSERNKETFYKVVATLNGYSTFEKDFAVKNLKFNKEKIDEELIKAKITSSMFEPVTVGTTALAILTGIKTDQYLGIYSVAHLSNKQYVSIPVLVYNTGYTSASTNPNYITVIGGSRTYSYDTATYSWSLPFEAVDLQPNTYTSGFIVFVLPEDEHVFTVVYDNGYDLIKKDIYVE